MLTKCIVSLVDKYTLKSKAHKNSLAIFMKSLMEVKVRSHSKGDKKLANNNNTHSNNNNLETDDLLDDEDD